MNVTNLVQQQRKFFETGATRPVEFRREMLTKLQESLLRHETSLLDAVSKDLRRSPEQTYLAEIAFVASEITFALKNLKRWTRRRRQPVPLLAWPARLFSQAEPYGVALIMGPWNYPIQLVLAPLVSAIAAGNCAVIKPSELAPATSAAVTGLIKATFQGEYIAAVEGGGEVAAQCLREPFHKIFYTGSGKWGRVVMAAAAEKLIPVTLELGGKSPCIVCEDAPVALAAKRIAWGKFINAGQTCTAPDFVLVHRSVKDAFLRALQQSITAFYTEDPRASVDYSRIINRQQFDRLVGLLRSEEVARSGEHDAADLYLAPTVLANVSPDAPVMQEEIFGPILPVLEFEKIEEVVELLRDRPTPLAMYLFTANMETQETVLEKVRSGGVCINDTLMHMMGKAVPFGGLGESGMGAYHGKHGFDCFSHQRSIMKRGFGFEPSFRYPPLAVPLGTLRRVSRFLLNR